MGQEPCETENLEYQVNNAEKRLLEVAPKLSQRIADRSPEEIQRVEGVLIQTEIRNYNWLEKIRSQEAISLAKSANYKY